MSDDREIFLRYLDENPIDFDDEFDRVTFRHATASDKRFKAAARVVEQTAKEIEQQRLEETERQIPYFADPPFSDED